MGQRLAKLRRRAGRLVQLTLAEQGTRERVLAAHHELRAPLFQRALYDKMGGRHFTAFSPVALVRLIRECLLDRGLEIDDVKIIVDANPMTQALIIKADADEMSVRRAEVRADKLVRTFRAGATA